MTSALLLYGLAHEHRMALRPASLQNGERYWELG
jgi:hypothetical protein